jgi:hypothetical protein
MDCFLKIVIVDFFLLWLGKVQQSKLGNGPHEHKNNNFRKHIKTGGFLKIETNFFSIFSCNMLILLVRRRFVAESFCSQDVLLQETFCYGDFMLRRRFVWRRFVQETFCMCAFCILLVPFPQGQVGGYSVGFKTITLRNVQYKVCSN